MMKDKKGLSEVVTAILIVLLAVAAVVIVWAVIRPMIQKSAGEVQTACVTLDLSIEKVDKVNDKVTVKRNVGVGDLVAVKFVLDEGATSEVIEKTVAAGELDELETKQFDVAPTAPKTWVDVTKVEIAGEVMTETEETKLCPVVDSMLSDVFT